MCYFNNLCVLRMSLYGKILPSTMGRESPAKDVKVSPSTGLFQFSIQQDVNKAFSINPGTHVKSPNAANRFVIFLCLFCRSFDVAEKSKCIYDNLVLTGIRGAICIGTGSEQFGFSSARIGDAEYHHRLQESVPARDAKEKLRQ